MRRKQINVRLDEDVLTAIEDIRGVMRPIPSQSDVIRQAILQMRERVVKKVARQQEG